MASTFYDYSPLLEAIVEHICIPRSLYEKAAARHVSLGKWLKREGSSLYTFDPDIRPQGSFRFGTVIRPLRTEDEYDLDNVCVLKIAKLDRTQKDLKTLYGNEVKAYAIANSILKPVKEHHRCWRLRYTDEVSFHLDTVPSVPEDDDAIWRLLNAGVREDLARRAIAITDDRDPNYARLSTAWPSSNPRGFAVFFEEKARLARTRLQKEGKLRATVEEVPPYEWSTPLQLSIQILKRHRDVMFRDVPELAPISMIITNLAACVYEGEIDLGAALTGIVEKMPGLVRAKRPRVPNPANPLEDYADKWSRDPRLEKSFFEWIGQARRDLEDLAKALDDGNVAGLVKLRFDVKLTDAERRRFGDGGGRGPRIVTAAPTLLVPNAPRPWGLKR